LTDDAPKWPKSTARFSAQQVGSYDYFHGARYLNPLLVQLGNPSLVDAHESAHRQLAEINILDVFGRLLTSVLTNNELSLSNDHTAAIFETLSVTNRETVYIHEVFATYEGFRWVFILLKDESEREDLRRSLTGEYRGYLSDGEATFGSVKSRGFVESGIEIIIKAVAIAALNIPIDADFAALNRLGDFNRNLKRASPEKRFRRLLKFLKTRAAQRHLEDLLTSFDYNGDMDAFQNRVHEWIRIELPDLRFVRKQEDPDALKRLASRLEDSLRSAGYTRFNGWKFVQPGEEGITQYGGKAVIPGVPWDFIQDASLYVHPFQLVTTAVFVAMVLEPLAQGYVTYLNALSVDTDDKADLKVGFYTDMGELFCSGGVKTTFGEWRAATKELPVARMPVKIASMLPLAIPAEFARLGHPTFVISNETPAEALETLEALSNGTRVGMLRMQLDGDNYSAMLLHIPARNFALLWASTELGINTLQFYIKARIDWIQIPPDDLSIESAFKLNKVDLTGLIYGWTKGTAFPAR
jgi:hypothetical protein